MTPLAGQLAAKGYGVIDAVGPELSPALTAPGIGLPVVDLALVSADLSASPDLPEIAARLRAAWPRVPVVRLPTLARDRSLDEICEQLDEIVLAVVQSRADAERLRDEAQGLAAQVRRARAGLDDAVADARRLMSEARHLSDRGRPGKSWP
ncbi:hypothetical protein EU555_28305 [Methylobacterium nonmethylotrophicum]|uniref:Uncharacterized protein n=1 Tax=Methylobacterium nonmethylotrophicum TaxID=1141884 RepID=A0A4Z0NH64_9HYPH|nr:hypothetical protein EU555_28305 [Methylobacterium nonmethylotrophicum]